MHLLNNTALCNILCESPLLIKIGQSLHVWCFSQLLPEKSRSVPLLRLKWTQILRAVTMDDKWVSEQKTRDSVSGSDTLIKMITQIILLLPLSYITRLL